MKVFLHFLKPYWKMSLLTLIVVIFDVVGALMIPTITADMINIGVNGGTLEQMIQKGLFMLLVTVLSGLGALLGSWLCAELSSRIVKDIRDEVYDKSLAFSSSDFERFGTGSMITRTLNDTNIIQQAFVIGIQMIVPVPFMCIMGIVFAFNINKDMGLLVLGAMFLVVLVASLIIKKASVIFSKLQKFLDRMNVVLRENITGVRVIRAFNKEPHEQGRMNKSFEDYAKASIKANQLFSLLDSWALFAINICIVLILYFGGNFVADGTMNIGDITALTEYAILTLFYIIMAQMVMVLLPRAKVCLNRIGEIINYTPEIADGQEQTTFDETTDEIVRFENATFRFGDADEDTLSKMNFVCRKGQTTAVIGGTGSGKTTIAKLLLRYHDVTAGKVMLKGCDIRDMTQQELRGHISYVPQKAWLFSGTIADNLRYGNENAIQEEMLHALKVAQSDFVLTLPDGIRSHVAQGGTNFSGGQKHRLSIARTLMKKADLYIFDDSFSALDFKTDAALRKALEEETKNAAVLIIAQRISTILHAEQIVVLDDGKIVGIGTHDDLMEHCSVYRDIANSQMKGGVKNGQ